MNNIYDLMNDISPDASITDRCIVTENETKDILAFIRRRAGSETNKSSETKNTKRDTERQDSETKIIPIGRRGFGKHVSAAAVAVIVAVSASVGGIAYAAIKWNQALEQDLQVTSEQKIELAKEGLASDVGLTATDNDVTISVDQCLVDNYFAYVSFSVSGYELEDGKEPSFDIINFDIEGDDLWSGSGSFYDNIAKDANGNILPDAESQYVLDDGTLQYIWSIYGSEKGSLIGKQVHVSIEGIGTVYKAVYTPVLDGTWEFDWTFGGSDLSVVYTPGEALGDSGAIVASAEISPISISIDYDFPMQEITEEAVDSDGNTVEATTYKEPPAFAGFKLKDGTLLTGLGDGGRMGYIDGDTTTYHLIEAFGKVIDTDEIDALLFIKSYSEGEETLAEENLYTVPIKG